MKGRMTGVGESDALSCAGKRRIVARRSLRVLTSPVKPGWPAAETKGPRREIGLRTARERRILN